MRGSSSSLGRLWAACLGAIVTFGLAACGPATARDRSAGASLAPAVCATTVADTLGQVGERVYHAAVSGDDVAQAVGRVRGSKALAAAIDARDANAAAGALRALLRGQIVRVEVLRGGRVLAAAGAGTAIAPVRGSIPGTGASFVLSVQSASAYLHVVRQITGAQVLLSTLTTGGSRRLAGTIPGPPPAKLPDSGPLSYAGRSYEVASLAGAAYPASALRISLLVPAARGACPGSGSQTRVETLAHVGERIYGEELESPAVRATRRRLESSAAFQRAVAARSASAARAAILGFFAAHIHVVRVRVTVGGRLLIDEGGPYVLAPVRGTLRSHGRVVGSFEMSIQDDAGYLKLAHLFTGAEVLMRVAGRQVQGTLDPGPASVPDRGTVSYAGRTYEAYSFTAEAFPSGALRISLLIGR